MRSWIVLLGLVSVFAVGGCTVFEGIGDSVTDTDESTTMDMNGSTDGTGSSVTGSTGFDTLMTSSDSITTTEATGTNSTTSSGGTDTDTDTDTDATTAADATTSDDPLSWFTEFTECPGGCLLSPWPQDWRFHPGSVGPAAGNVASESFGYLESFQKSRVLEYRDDIVVVDSDNSLILNLGSLASQRVRFLTRHNEGMGETESGIGVFLNGSSAPPQAGCMGFVLIEDGVTDTELLEDGCVSIAGLVANAGNAPYVLEFRIETSGATTILHAELYREGDQANGVEIDLDIDSVDLGTLDGQAGTIAVSLESNAIGQRLAIDRIVGDEL